MSCSSFAGSLRWSLAITQTKQEKLTFYCKTAQKSFQLRRRAAKTSPRRLSSGLLLTVILNTLFAFQSGGIARTARSRIYRFTSPEKRRSCFDAKPRTTLLNSPRLYGQHKKAPGNLILVKSLSRFGRDTVETIKQIRRLKRMNIGVYRRPPPFGDSNARRKWIPPAPRFCLRQNTRTAQKRRRPEGRSGSSPATILSITKTDFSRPIQSWHRCVENRRVISQ